MKPEAQARHKIDAMLIDAGWVVQEYDQLSLGAQRGVAIAEFPSRTAASESLHTARHYHF